MKQNATEDNQPDTVTKPPNYREDQDTRKRVCGQAAVVSMLDFYRVPLGIEAVETGETDDRLHWPNAKAINAVSNCYPPNHMRGLLGTTPEQIVAALRHWGLTARVEQAHGSREKHQIWEQIQESVNGGAPVITVVNRSKIEALSDGNGSVSRVINKLPMAHWAIIHHIDDTHVHVSNLKRGTQVRTEVYFRAMYDWWMRPFKFHNCAIFVSPR